MTWSIQDVARRSGTTSRTLRHYDAIGLLAPTDVDRNGYRRYDEAALVRLQRILLLRELGLGLTEIARVLVRESSAEDALEAHLVWLTAERERLARQIASVARTIDALKGGEQLMADDMFDGFDHTAYREEVVERWGEKAYADGDRWWRGLSDDERRAFRSHASQLAKDWGDAVRSGQDPAGETGQDLARRHVAWLRSMPTAGLPSGADLRPYVIGLGQMYVDDPRFGKNYGGATGAGFVRDALRIYAESNL